MEHECTCHLGHPPCSFCTDPDPLQQLYDGFVEEYEKDPKDTSGFSPFFYYYEMSSRTFSMLPNLSRCKSISVSMEPILFTRKEKHLQDKVLGKILAEQDGLYVCLPLIEADLPEGKTILRKKEN